MDRSIQVDIISNPLRIEVDMIAYTSIKVFTREGARFEGKDVSDFIVNYVHSLKIAARCVVYRGIEGCYENGKIATSRMVAMSNDLPVIIEIMLPSAEAERVVSRLESVVIDGLVSVVPAEVTSYMSPKSFIPSRISVKDIMTEHPFDGHPDFSVRIAVELLLDNNLKCLPIIDDGKKVIGILTQGDLVKRTGMPVRLGLLKMLPPHDLKAWMKRAETLSVADVMTRSPETVHDNVSVKSALHIMVRQNLKRLPVIDSNEELCGILSRIDVLKALVAVRVDSTAVSREQNALSTASKYVRDLTARDMLALEMDTPLSLALESLIKEESQRAAIVDQQGRLAGLLTDTMILRALDRNNPRRRGLFHMNHGRHAESLCVSEIMQRDIVGVKETTTLEDAVVLMTEKGFKRIPVIDEAGKFLGMIRRDSILIALAQRKNYLPGRNS